MSKPKFPQEAVAHFCSKGTCPVCTSSAQKALRRLSAPLCCGASLKVFFSVRTASRGEGGAGVRGAGTGAAATEEAQGGGAEARTRAGHNRKAACLDGAVIGGCTERLARKVHSPASYSGSCCPLGLVSAESIMSERAQRKGSQRTHMVCTLNNCLTRLTNIPARPPLRAGVLLRRAFHHPCFCLLLWNLQALLIPSPCPTHT